MRCDSCGKDLTNKAVRILPDFYDGRNYYACDRYCEDSLIESRDYLEQVHEEMEREMYEELFGNQFR